jgi:hypothetical protein
MTALVLAIVLAAEPVLPEDRSPWAPGLLVQDGKGAAPSASHEESTVCGSCHVDVAAQWKTSAHAFASFNNPLYRVAVERTRSEVGFAASRMCAGCHDLALLTSGGMDQPIAPGDPRAHAGVSCTSCHSATHATLDGNGSLTLRSDTALPETIEAATVENHRQRVVSPVLRTAELCAGCHRSFLGAQTGNASAFFGMDDFGAWQKSAYNHSTAERPDAVIAQDCRGCHMPKEDAVLGDVAAKKGKITSHRFLGSHTTLAAMRGDADTVRRVQDFLKDSVRVEISGARTSGGPFVETPSALPLSGGAGFEVDVVVFNERVGHRFPGSVMDNQGTKLEVELVSASGRVLAVANQHELRSEVVDVTGEPVHERQTHRFVSAVWNHTVPARDARAVRIGFEVPLALPKTEFPLSVRARVVHQTRLPELGALACRDGATDRGRAFLESASALLGQRLDPCVEAPRTVVATQTLTFDGKTTPRFDPAWRRALALSVSLQEYLGDAEQAFAQARALSTSKEQEGRALWGLASIAGKRGQTDAALQFLSEAEARLGQTAATWKTRGDVYAQVWRWPLASEAYAQAAALAPDDVTVWQQLAMSEASAGRYPQALAAAQRGIALFPRDADCLRVQALSLIQLKAPKAVQERSLAAALQWRVPDEGPAAKGRCSKRIAGCADRRNPVPTYQAASAGPLAAGP